MRELLLALYRFPLDAEVVVRTADGGEVVADVAARSSAAPEIVPQRLLTLFKAPRVRRKP